jgi:hypothetical protein
LRWSCSIKSLVESFKHINSFFLKCDIKLSYMTDKNIILLRRIAFLFLNFILKILLCEIIFRLSSAWNLSEFKRKSWRSCILLIAFTRNLIIELFFHEIEVYSLLIYFTAIFLWGIIFVHPYLLRVLKIILISSLLEKKIVKILLW